jgi:hypothetical protein
VITGTALVEIRGDDPIHIDGYPLNDGWHFEDVNGFVSIYWYIKVKK